MRMVAIAAAALLLAASAGCGDREPELGGAADTAGAPASAPLPETGGTTEGPRAFIYEQRQDFTQTVRDQLADLDRQIEELASQAKSAGGGVSDRALANIRASRQSVDRSLDRVGNATAENWEEIRGGVDEAVEYLTEAVERAYPK
ncbi:MAG: hypothetical protein H0V43_01985 [Gemmatimonadales bacterium]|nr:hypothetical protein [Gemmatimonadales bacterium]MBA3555442.1 hypothetical protein [Gemmatimonadales bacterium]